ncbi:sensor histidine kinase [Microbacterium sp. ARD32]|uniref:sensor histidine kinase n=1 Tax=Microbacterium sp. ARD32 TaxID=2962577 RepID=UPI0028813EBC|nr:sensor histidine kinase [Microbacterium sp. ARD32]MDT0156522.1 sensor histidine kinase [Microbacterium sp. ARD32]
MTRESHDTAADRKAPSVRSAAGSTPATWMAKPHGGAPKSPWDRFGWLMAVIWLVFLVYPVLALLESVAPVMWIIVAWVAMAAFVVLYVVGFMHGLCAGGGLGRAPGRPAQWLFFAGLIVCAALSIPAEGGVALSFLPFIMSFASYGLNRIAHWTTFTVAVALTLGWMLISGDVQSYISILAIVLLLGVVNTVSTWLILRSADAERLSLELATSEGREAVARDVHDLIGHSLTVVKMKAQLARRLIDTDPERAKTELADIEALAAEAISGVRSTVAGARAASLTEQLAASSAALKSAGVSPAVDGEPGALSPAQGLTASWILREATTNILRHAQATRATVTLRPGMLAVQDDGRGMSGHEGNGVRGMRERAAAAGAQFQLSQPPTGGTRVEVTW